MCVLPKPSANQLEYLDSEIGVIIHLDLQVFDNTFNFRNELGVTPDATIFNPTQLDTDQWLECASNLGAKYAVLVAKHCSGFSLWPTKAHDYSVASSPWRGGQGDIVKDFVASCHKFGIKPGLYCSAAANGYLKVDNPGIVVGGSAEDNRRYVEIVEIQLTELWSNYGELFELWFDGGVIPVEKGGPKVFELQQRYQPDAIVFSGPPECKNLIRWAGSESGVSVLPALSTVDSKKLTFAGDFAGDAFIPIECDMPNRHANRSFQGGWFWHEGQDDSIYSVAELVDKYYKSVGQNANLLLGMVIDNRGLFPENDKNCFESFGKVIKRINSIPRDTTSGEDLCIELDVTQSEFVSEVLIAEDISCGESIRSYVIEAWVGAEWIGVFEGRGIGHKRLINFGKVATSKLRLRVVEFVGKPIIKEFSAYLKKPQIQAPTIRRDDNGFISVEAQAGVSVYYTLDGSMPTEESMLYTEPVCVTDAGVFSAVAIADDGEDKDFPELKDNLVSSLDFGTIPKGWEVLYSDGEYDEHNKKENLLDSTGEIWISGKQDNYPHHVIIDLKEDEVLKGFVYTPSWRPGLPREYKLYVGDSPDKVDKLIASGIFSDIENRDPAPYMVKLEKFANSRYVKFELTASAVKTQYASIGHLEFII